MEQQKENNKNYNNFNPFVAGVELGRKVTDDQLEVAQIMDLMGKGKYQDACYFPWEEKQQQRSFKPMSVEDYLKNEAEYPKHFYPKENLEKYEKVRSMIIGAENLALCSGRSNSISSIIGPDGRTIDWILEDLQKDRFSFLDDMFFKRAAELGNNQTILHNIIDNNEDKPEAQIKAVAELNEITVKHMKLFLDIKAMMQTKKSYQNSIDIGQSLKNNDSIEITKILPPKDKATATTTTKHTTIRPVNPIDFKFLYAKENHKLEIHMELEWTTK